MQQKKNTLQYFRVRGKVRGEQVTPLPMPAGAHGHIPSYDLNVNEQVFTSAIP